MPLSAQHLVWPSYKYHRNRRHVKMCVTDARADAMTHATTVTVTDAMTDAMLPYFTNGPHG